MENLNGLQLKDGFTKAVRDLYAGADGCPNVVNLLLTSVPLAINTSWMIKAKHGIPEKELLVTRTSQMKDVCISYRSDRKNK